MSKLDQIDIYHNQAAILGWLRGMGHAVDFGPDPHAPPLKPVPGFTPPTVRVLQSYNGKPCPYCGFVMMHGSKRSPTRDHIKPRHAGGTLTDPSNMLVVCASCNNDKGGNTLLVWREKLRHRGDARAEIVDAFFKSAYR